MKVTQICGIIGLMAISLEVFAAPCKYDLAKDSVSIQWTAFKTTEKVPVKGSFKKVTVTGQTTSTQLAKLAEGLKVSVDPQSLDTANPTRNETIATNFFKKLAPSEVVGHIVHFSAEKKSFTLTLTFNGQTKDVPMTFEQKGDDLTATGTMNIDDFGGSEALASLNKACLDLHKGKDGVSKTWSEVSLNFQAKVKSSCGS